MSTRDPANQLEIMRHSFAHVLALATLRLYKNAKLGIGPAIENGFYHDFLFDPPINQEDLRKIEDEMQRIIAQELPFQQILVTKDEAFDILNLQGQIFKTEILNSITDEQISFYKTGLEFIDLCRGPHVEHTGKLGAFKLTGISGTNWNNDPSRAVMQRIHGVAFATKKDLERYFEESAQKSERDHRKISQLYELYTTDHSFGSGVPIWLTKGTMIKKKIYDFIFEQNFSFGFKPIETPIIIKQTPDQSYVESIAEGQENAKFPSLKADKEEFILRSQILYEHIALYRSKKFSYRSLPYKTSEIGKVFRFEKTGELNGLTKIREFEVESNMIICSKDQIQQSITQALKLTKTIYAAVGLDKVKAELALKRSGDEAGYYQGDPKIWRQLENKIVASCASLGISTIEAPNTAEACGPGINFKLADVFGRELKLGSLFFDISGPVKYNLTFLDSHNKAKQPYLIFHSSIGSLPRFFALLTEKYGGLFPLWLSPIQVKVIPISEKFINYANEITSQILSNNIIAESDNTPETMQKKIRRAQTELIPYMVIVGEKEESNKSISVRPRSGQDLGLMKIEEFINQLKIEISAKTIF